MPTVNGIDYEFLGFLAPQPLPAFVLPAFIVTEEPKTGTRRTGSISRDHVFIQDGMDDEVTGFVSVSVDNATLDLPLSREITVVAGTGHYGAGPISDTFDRLFDGGIRAHAFADSQGMVYAGNRNDLSRFLLERFLTGSNDFPAFAGLELARFARNQEAIQSQRQACRRLLQNENAELADQWFDFHFNTGEAGGGFMGMSE